MEAGDMLDVLHYLYEEDVLPRWEQDNTVKSNFRVTLYRDLYGKSYKYRIREGAANNSASGAGDGDGFGLPEGPPESQAVKPFVPATDPEDLQALLGDGPMGG